MKKYLLIAFLFFGITSYSQSVSCEDLLSFIQDKGTYVSKTSSFIMQSSWLQEVVAYRYESKYYVVAKIKKDEYSYSTNTYIFCGIPYMNWSNFQYGGYGDSNSYGERFHKYIMDYQCNCN